MLAIGGAGSCIPEPDYMKNEFDGFTMYANLTDLQCVSTSWRNVLEVWCGVTGSGSGDRRHFVLLPLQLKAAEVLNFLSSNFNSRMCFAKVTHHLIIKALN